MGTLNENQRKALKMMDARNLGAVYVNGGWVFRQTVREHPGVALQVEAALETADRIARGYTPRFRFTVSTERTDRDGPRAYATADEALTEGRRAAARHSRPVTLTVWSHQAGVVSKEVVNR